MTARDRARMRWGAMRRLRRDGIQPNLTVAGEHPGPSPDVFREHVLGLFGEELLRRLLPGHFKEIGR